VSQQCHNYSVTTTVSQQQCHNNSVTTTASQQQCHNSKFVIFQMRILNVFNWCNFLWVQWRYKCSPAASFANSVMTLYLFKIASANVSFCTNNSKMPNLGVVTLLSQMSDIYIYIYIYIYTHTQGNTDYRIIVIIIIILLLLVIVYWRKFLYMS